MAAEQGVTTEPPFAAETENSVPHHDAGALPNIPEIGIVNRSYNDSNDRGKSLLNHEFEIEYDKRAKYTDVALSKLEDEKKLSFIKTWEESEIAKVENRAQKKLAKVSSWENTHRASIEHQLKIYEEQLEKKKAEHAEKMMNKMALIRKQAEERRAMVEAQRGKGILAAEEMAAKHIATGHLPKKGFACFRG